MTSRHSGWDTLSLGGGKALWTVFSNANYQGCGNDAAVLVFSGDGSGVPQVCVCNTCTLSIIGVRSLHHAYSPPTHAHHFIMSSTYHHGVPQVIHVHHMLCVQTRHTRIEYIPFFVRNVPDATPSACCCAPQAERGSHHVDATRVSCPVFRSGVLRVRNLASGSPTP